MAIFTAISTFVAYAGTLLAAATGLSIGAATSLATFAISSALSLGLSLVQRMLKPSVKVPVSEIQAVISQTDAARRIYVGENLVGGIRAFYEVKDSRLYQLIVVSHGRIMGFKKFWVDGQEVDVAANGNITSGKYQLSWPGYGTRNFVHVQTRSGGGLGGDYANLISDFGSWNSNRRLTGQATFLVNMLAPNQEIFNTIFPNSYNTSLQWVINGQSIYDPRTNDNIYRSNAALVIVHYLRHADGYRLTQFDVDYGSVAAMADVADIEIPRLEGGTTPSLRLWGYWTLDESPQDVLGRMHSSSGIRPYETQDGRVGLIGGNFGIPSMTLTAKDISSIKTSPAINEREGYNTLRVFHMSRPQKYEVVEVDPWQIGARVAVEGEISEEYRMEMCPNVSQARRLAKQQIFNDNRAKVWVDTNLVGLKARFPRTHGQRHTILLDYRPGDGSGREIVGEYEVLDHAFDPVGMTCRIELGEVDRASDSWTPAEEGAITEVLPPSEPNLPPVISAVLTQRIVQISAGVRQAVLEVDAVPLAGRDDLVIQAGFRKVGATVWTTMQVSGYTAASGAVEDGANYEARVRFNGIFDTPDEWDSLGPVTIQIDGTPPGTPIEFIPSNGAGYVHLSWRNPAGDFFALRIYRSEGTDFASASLIGSTGGVSGQISEYEDDTIAAATEYNYWVAAANISGVEGSPVGPANITTT